MKSVTLRKRNQNNAEDVRSNKVMYGSQFISVGHSLIEINYSIIFSIKVVCTVFAQANARRLLEELEQFSASPRSKVDSFMHLLAGSHKRLRVKSKSKNC